MSTLLVTGASGFLGFNVCRQAVHDRWRVVGVVHTHHVQHVGVESVVCDLTDDLAVRRLFERCAPSAVIHLAAVSQPNQCEREPRHAWKLNVDAAVRIARLCAEARVPLVFSSTDLVFDGGRAPYTEGDPVGPVNEYGRQKVAAEEGVMEAWHGTIVCRMPLMYGEPGPVASSFVQPWCDALARGETLRLFVDEYRTPVSGRDAARGLLATLSGGGGVLHLGGRERISRYEFGRCLVELRQCDPRLLVPVTQAEVPMAAARPADVSLDSSRAFRDLNYAPGAVRDELSALFGRR